MPVGEWPRLAGGGAGPWAGGGPAGGGAAGAQGARALDPTIGGLLVRLWGGASKVDS